MTIKKLLALATAALILLPAFALATEEFDGNVVAGSTIAITAPYGGTVQSVQVREGSMLHTGDDIVTMDTTQVLAPADGTVRGIFAEVGDALSGAVVMYVAPVNKYTVACTIGKAYASIDTRYVHIGETVYIKCKPDGSHKAVGVVTAVKGDSYTVETTAGELYMEETVYLYRSDAYTTETRIGSGTVSRTAELAVTGSGSLLRLCVQDGDEVERGQLLFETVDGTLDAGVQPSDTVTADTDGVVASVKVAAGQKVAKGDVLLTVYQPAAYQIAFSIGEDLLSSVQVGEPVNIVFNWNDETGAACKGTVTDISYINSTESTAEGAAGSGGTTSAATSATTYTGYASFTPDDSVRLGMSVTVSTIDD